VSSKLFIRVLPSRISCLPLSSNPPTLTRAAFLSKVL
jgi:hypothetical protein